MYIRLVSLINSTYEILKYQVYTVHNVVYKINM